MNNVILYGASWCPGCRTAKSYFKDNNIPFIYKDVDEHVNAVELQARGISSIPMIIIKEEVIVGFNAEKINYFLR